MGNSFSYQSTDENSQESEKSIERQNIVNYIDNIATNYILKQNMIDMLRFTDKEYYDNLILLTASIFKKQLTSLELGILQDRVLNSSNSNELNNNIKKNNNVNSNKNKNNNEIVFSSVNDLKEITIENEKVKQKALIIVSKFYIKIMTIFSAITSVIDPQYVFEDSEGSKHFFQLKDYNSYKMIDKHSKELKVHQLDNPMALVKKRLNILKNKLNNSNNNNNNNSNYVTINPGEKFCELNKPNDGEESKKLTNEIGIKELDTLYYDIYDNETKKWNKKSTKMQKKYEKDLLKFYQIFTGKKIKPTNVKSFEDIEMLPFHNLHRCKNQDYFKDLLVSKNDSLFKKYMNKIDQIHEISKTYKRKLLFILKTIFIYKKDNNENDTSFIINPDLNIEKIIELQEQTKDCILNIYTNCEKHFLEALLIYEKMYEKQFGVLNNEKINNLSTNSNVQDENITTTGSISEQPSKNILNGELLKQNQSEAFMNADKLIKNSSFINSTQNQSLEQVNNKIPSFGSTLPPPPQAQQQTTETPSFSFGSTLPPPPQAQQQQVNETPSFGNPLPPPPQEQTTEIPSFSNTLPQVQTPEMKPLITPPHIIQPSIENTTETSQVNNSLQQEIEPSIQPETEPVINSLQKEIEPSIQPETEPVINSQQPETVNNLSPQPEITQTNNLSPQPEITQANNLSPQPETVNNLSPQPETVNNLSSQPETVNNLQQPEITQTTNNLQQPEITQTTNNLQQPEITQTTNNLQQPEIAPINNSQQKNNSELLQQSKNSQQKNNEQTTIFSNIFGTTPSTNENTKVPEIPEVPEQESSLPVSNITKSLNFEGNNTVPVASPPPQINNQSKQTGQGEKNLLQKIQGGLEDMFGS